MMVSNLISALDDKHEHKMVVSTKKFKLPSRSLKSPDINAKKRRVFAATTQLPKFKLSIGIICLTSFGLVIIDPIVNYNLIISFNNEVQQKIDLLGKIIR